MTDGSTPLEQLLARMLGELGNRSLNLDPLSRARLGALAGTRVRFQVLPPGRGEPRSLNVLVTEDVLALEAGAGGDAHVVLTGTLPDIARTLLGQRGAGSVRIDGDEARLAALADLFRQLEPDLAVPLGDLMGRDLADGLIGAAEAGVALLKSAAESLTRSAQQEARASFVDQQDFEALRSRIEALRLRVDRLAARTDLLTSARTRAPSQTAQDGGSS